jgi:hypothetical protein
MAFKDCVVLLCAAAACILLLLPALTFWAVFIALVAGCPPYILAVATGNQASRSHAPSTQLIAFDAAQGDPLAPTVSDFKYISIHTLTGPSLHATPSASQRIPPPLRQQVFR